MRSDAEAFGVVTSGYYRHPDVDDATRALRHWLTMLAGADEEQLARMVVLLYLFGGISQRSEEARAAFAPLLQGYTGPHAPVAQRLLDPALPDVLRVPLERPETLDLLWAEFFVTGEPAAVERIFTALDDVDHVRRRLDAWLAEKALFGKAKRRETAAALASAGLVVDLERRVIVSAGDLDCLCFAIAEKRVPIFKLLPFELPPAELMRLATKASAVWSLRLNARDHERAAAIVAAQAQRAGGPARRLAAEPVPAAPPFAL